MNKTIKAYKEAEDNQEKYKRISKNSGKEYQRFLKKKNAEEEIKKQTSKTALQEMKEELKEEIMREIGFKRGRKNTEWFNNCSNHIHSDYARQIIEKATKQTLKEVEEVIDKLTATDFVTDWVDVDDLKKELGLEQEK